MSTPLPPVDLDTERAALDDARAAVQTKLADLAGLNTTGGGADALADEYIDAVVRGTVQTLQRDLVVFGRIDDERAWRVGLYGIDRGGEQLVLDWRAPFAGAFYQARIDDPMGLRRRATYVGSITDLFVEDFASGEISGSSPLMAELSRKRGTEMRAAVATLQSEQDALVRLPPTARLVLRGGPGTGKTVVGLHRAAWLVYNDTRLTAGRILVLGPSDRFLRFVSAVLPTLGEARILQTTFARMFGPDVPGGADERWLPVLDDLEASLFSPDVVRARGKRLPADQVAEIVERVRGRRLPLRERRKVFVKVVADRMGVSNAEANKAVAEVWPALTSKAVWTKLRRHAASRSADEDLPPLPAQPSGALFDEVRARVEGVPATYGHVIVDEAQDLTLLQLRAVQRRSDGLTLVGDDAQRSVAAGIGLVRAAELLDAEPATMATAYRMSAEIADWLNAHAAANGIDAVVLDGIRPTGVSVRIASDPASALADVAERWETVALIEPGEVWDHKGVEYDAVVVDRRGMAADEVYLAASRAAHELVVVD